MRPPDRPHGDAGGRPHVQSNAEGAARRVPRHGRGRLPRRGRAALARQHRRTALTRESAPMLGRSSSAMMRLAVAGLVDFSRRHAAVLASALALLAVLLGSYTARRISIDTDEQKLISPNLPWRKTAAELDLEFPQNKDLLAIVVDAPTPDQASDAAAALTARLRSLPGLFSDVRQPDASQFFRRSEERRVG